MHTGMKNVDDLILRFGVMRVPGRDLFQHVLSLCGSDIKANTMKLPFCFYRVITSLPPNRQLLLHQFYLPHKKARLASFLIDEEGKIVEQVYFQRDRKYVLACRKLQLLVSNNYEKPMLSAA